MKGGQKGITVSEIQTALEQTSGNICQAATILGLRVNTLRRRIRANEELNKRWEMGSRRDITAPVISEHQELTRPEIEVSIPEIPAPVDDGAFDAGLETIGISGQEKELVKATENFYRSFYQRSLDYMGGNMVSVYIRLHKSLISVENELNTLLASHKQDVDREDILRKDRIAIIRQMNEIYDRADQAERSRFEKYIQQRKLEAAATNKQPKGFLAIQAKTVNVNGNGK